MNLLDEEEKRKLVLYYAIYTFMYFPTLLSLLIWTHGIHIVGQYDFQSYLFMITVAETAKHLASSLNFHRSDCNLSKRPEKSLVAVAWRMIFSGNTLKEGAKTVLTVTVSMFVFFLISVLFGAEVFDSHEETIMFSALLSTLTIFPTCLNVGPQHVLPLLVGVRPTNVMESLMAQNMLLTLVGAWLGAIPIPLDWDRPWQKWPITCSIGAMIGFVVSHVLMLYRIRGRGVKKQK